MLQASSGEIATEAGPGLFGLAFEEGAESAFASEVTVCELERVAVRG